MNKPLGSMRKDAYLEIRIDKHKYYAHVLAWVLYYNEWPAPGKVVDHINGKPYDNRKEIYVVYFLAKIKGVCTILIQKLAINVFHTTQDSVNIRHT